MKPMALDIIDSHTGGEPTRVIIAGGPALTGPGPAEQREELRTQHDWLRTAAIHEPRGSDVIVGALLLPPSDPAFDAGVIFFNNVGYLNMCGHGLIGLAVTLRHMGRARVGQTLRVETPVGEVQAELLDENRVRFANVPSYRHRQAVELELPGHGEVRGDVAWGGNWFFLVEDHGLRVHFDEIPQLRDFSLRVKEAILRKGLTGADGGEIDHIELFATAADIGADSRNFVLCPGAAYDRSPCGTGTSAKLACLWADGKLSEGQVWRQASILGSVFEGSVRVVDGQIIPLITGEAHVTSEAKFLLNAKDPFRHGITPESVR